ncbi:TP53-binding protein 1-like isoform X2 [Anopheles moucheti]|uniref:TP53-binding protein 1-like isoform X2 n=1 Tax=Anopheles moucheti TaxID=186751 RepID=UPI0022F04292|nr:TP53-binding protein 1-like isoform X2 [Anopheles moucheti]
MDIGGTTKVASPESTVTVEKTCAAPEVSENPSASGKNGSLPDSSADSVKDTACVADSIGKQKDTSQETLVSPKPASDVLAKVDESNSIAELRKGPLKQPAVTTSTSGDISQPDCEPVRNDTPCNDKLDDQEQIDEDDELLKRMEAIEKGEDLDAVPEDANHQNGLLQKAVEKGDSGKETAMCVDAAKATTSSEAPVSILSESDATSKSAEAASPTFKRKHPFTVGEVEPQVKKVHIADVTDGPQPKATSSGTTPSPARQPSEASAEPPGSFETDRHQKEKDDKPPSVEKMEVDGSPEPAESSPKNVDMLPDTEPNTEPDAMDQKSEEISSSVVEEPVRQVGDSAENKKTENSNVSSSDDKQEGMTSENTKPPDSEVSASVLPAPSGDEAMDVDEDEIDMAESSTSTGPAASVAIPVVEPPCVKKVAYLCGKDDPKEADEKVTVVSTAKTSATSASTSSSTPAVAVAETSEVSVAKDVGSASKPSSGSAVSTKGGDEPEDVVDSSNIVSTVPKLVVESAEKSAESGKVLAERVVLEENIVGSSQPSSSSDTKKQSSSIDKRSSEQLRDSVHRSALLAKASSTPNQNASELTSSSSNPSTPKTLNKVTTSAVSSSNVYSSTPIHQNFGKVSSGNVSKITNPPSSIETSRIEADETATTSAISEQSESLMKTETEEKYTSHATSATKSLPSTTETASSATTGTMGTSDSSVKSTSPKKEPRHEDSSSSKGSLKTSGDVSEVDSCTVSGMNTAEEINLYVSNARKLNGISSTSEGSDLGTKDDVTKSLVSVKQEHDSKAGINSIQLDLSRAISPTTSAEQQYEVSVWYEGKELQFMSVERIHGGTKVDRSAAAVAETAAQDASNTDSSSKLSSTATTNGSVSSIGPFALPGAKTSSVGQSTDSSSSSATITTGVKLTHSVTVPQMKQTVLGPKALCDLLIEEFQKLRRTFTPDDSTVDDASTLLLKSPRTPYTGRGRKDSAKKSGARTQKRSKATDSDGDDDDDDVDNDARTPRSGGSSTTKQPAKRTKVVLTAAANESPVASSSTSTKSKIAQEPKQFDICCLARWTDRKYYAGRVTNYRGDNKYVVVFEDGCSKTLSRDIIVFGEDGVLPIQHHSIHALTGGDTYEPAIVEEIKRNDANEVVYCVRTATNPLEVTATDIYLTDEQAKWIHNACKDKPDPIQKLLQPGSSGVNSVGGGDAASGNQGNAPEGSLTPAASDLVKDAGDKGSRSTRSKRGAGANDKSMGSTTPEAGYSGGVGKKGRRGRRKQHLPPESRISECSDVSDTYEEEIPVPTSPETGLDAVDGVQPELQRTEQESELTRMSIVSAYFGTGGKDRLDQLLGPIPVDAKSLFRNKHFLLSCTVPSKGVAAAATQFSSVPFVKQHIRRQIEAGGGKVYQFFEDVPKNKYKQCKLIAPRPSTTAIYVQCLASNIVAVSHEWIIQCCQVMMMLDYKQHALPAGWSFLENRFIDWSSGRGKDKRTSSTPFASVCINVASLCKDFNDFWSRVCKLAGGTVRLIKTESDITENLTGYLLTDQEFPEEIKIKAARTGLLVVSTVWVVQSLILGRVCHPNSNEKLTQIYQEEDY